MNCQQAKDRWYECFDEGTTDVALDSHLESCPECRDYVQQMDLISSGLGELREVTQAVKSRSSNGLVSSPATINRSWVAYLRPVTALAASLLVIVTATLFYRSDRSDTSIVDGPVSPPVRTPALGVSPRGGSAENFLAVAKATSNDNVQVVWFYPSLVEPAKRDPS